MGKLLEEFQEKNKIKGVVVDWPIGGPVVVPRSVVERNRRVLTTMGESRDTLTDILRLLCFGVIAESVKHPKEEVIVAQDIAKGILSFCGVSLTLNGLVEKKLKEG